MIVVLDSSAAVELTLNRPQRGLVESLVSNADWVTSPDIFIAETANVLWKYHRYESLPVELCEEFIDKSIQLIDHFEPGSTLYREAFLISCETNHPIYDAFYLVWTRRNNGTLVSLDKKLISIAKSKGLKTGPR